MNVFLNHEPILLKNYAFIRRDFFNRICTRRSTLTTNMTFMNELGNMVYDMDVVVQMLSKYGLSMLVHKTLVKLPFRPYNNIKRSIRKKISSVTNILRPFSRLEKNVSQ